jgi:crotonobetainyl-CoA:carnitine CoA-transferase CaiB-like acyl-CoA transferase
MGSDFECNYGTVQGYARGVDVLEEPVMTTPEARSSTILDGLKVLDLSRVLAGPYCAQMLADHGADVTKVEAPDGDETRGWGPPFFEDGMSAYFHGLNRSKRNITLDLGTRAGTEVLTDLIASADVVVENFKAGTLARWGLDPNSVLLKRHPRLVYCCISGFGHDGPMGGVSGYDAVLQSYGGLMSVNGYADRGALRVGVPIVDIVAANLALTGILLALRERDRSGQGQYVDISLLDAVVSMLHPHSATWIVGGAVPQRTGEAHPLVAPYQVFATRTGDIFISAANNRQFRALTTALGTPELASDERFLTNSERIQNVVILARIIGSVVADRDREELYEKLVAYGVPASPVHEVSEALTSAQVVHRELVVDTGDYKGVGVPIKFGRSRPRRPQPPAQRGAHTEEILDSLGYDEVAKQRLRAAGAFGQLAVEGPV